LPNAELPPRADSRPQPEQTRRALGSPPSSPAGRRLCCSALAQTDLLARSGGPRLRALRSGAVTTMAYSACTTSPDPQTARAHGSRHRTEGNSRRPPASPIHFPRRGVGLPPHSAGTFPSALWPSPSAEWRPQRCPGRYRPIRRSGTGSTCQQRVRGSTRDPRSSPSMAWFRVAARRSAWNHLRPALADTSSLLRSRVCLFGVDEV
jgi:hypothetical protein